MEVIDMIVLGLLMVLGIILSVLAEKNRELSKENAFLRELLNKDTNSAVASIKHEEPKSESGALLSDRAQVITLVSQGKTIEEIAQSLQIPIDKVEMIIKFDRIKKEHASS